MKRSASLVGALVLVTAAVCQAQQPSPLAYTQPPPPPPPPPSVDDPLAGAFVPGPDAGCGFVDVDLAFLKTTLKFGLVSPMPLGPLGQTVRPPHVDLPWVVSPTFEVGYRLPGGDAVVASYRFLTAEGTGEVSNFITTSQVRTRLDVQMFDVDYAFPVYQVAPRFDVSARLGARLADVFFDSRSVNDLHQLQQASNDFFGAGIHGRLDLRYGIDLLPGLSVFGMLDAAVLVGRSRQKFHLQNDVDGFTEVNQLTLRGNKTVPTAKAQAGLSYAPPALPGLSFTSGYQYEQFFNVAHLGSSSGEFYSHGWFMRVRYDF